MVGLYIFDIEYSSFMTLCLWSMRMGHVISKMCYNVVLLQMNFPFGKVHGKTISHNTTVVYPNPC